MRTFVTMSSEHRIVMSGMQAGQLLFRPKHYRSELPSHVTFRTGRAGPWPYPRRQRRRRGPHFNCGMPRPPGLASGYGRTTRIPDPVTSFRAVWNPHFAYTRNSRLALGNAPWGEQGTDPATPIGRPGPFLRKRNHATH